MKFLFTLLMLAGMCASALATHLTGGELTYTHLGSSNYEVKLTVYRDCNNGVAPFDSPAVIGVFNSNGNLFTTLSLAPVIDTIPSTSSDTCFNTAASYCTDRGIYTGIVNLPPAAGGYTLAYQRCCRPGAVVNIQGANNVGFTITCSIPDAAYANNSSPAFNNSLSPYICFGMPFTFDHSATDPDGDALVYELCSAVDGASSSAPQPNPPSAPPYPPVLYSSPYSMLYPIAASPAFTINSSTGLLSGTPTQSGIFVIAICVKEYRNNILISTVRREVSLVVMGCQDPAYSVLASVDHDCGYTVDFTHSFGNQGSYYWDFGVTSASTDTSTQPMPSYTYPALGNYTVTLILQPNTSCADTASSTLVIDTCSPQSVHVMEVGRLNIYPNPSSSEFYIEPGASLNAFTLEMIDPQGRMVLRKHYSSASGIVSVDASNLPQGMYLVRMIAENGIYQQRLVVGRSKER